VPEGGDEGEGALDPGVEVGSVAQRLGVDEDPAGHLPSPHLHRLHPGQGLDVLGVGGIGADQEAAAARGGDRQVPLDHEGEPAEHPPLDHLARAGIEPVADFLGQLLVVGHPRQL